MNELCDRLKLIRRTLSLKQSDIANALMIKQSSYSMIEKGVRELTERNMTLLCDSYSINPIWLKTGKGEMFFEPTKENDVITEAISKDMRVSKDWLESGAGKNVQ